MSELLENPRVVFIIQALAVALAGAAVGVADAVIKKAAAAGSMSAAFRTSWMFLGYVLYFAQIYFFTYVFLAKWKLGIVGVLTMVVYTITVLIIGYFLFHEHLNRVQQAGIALALVAVVMMNWSD